MKIGLLGFGVVGRGVYDIVQNRKDMEIVKVVCLEDVTLPDAVVTKDFQDVLTDDSIDTVIEAMGGTGLAYKFVRSAMEAGKNIVTSNKALVAVYYDDLMHLAKEKGLAFRCTAAVGGGIGWLSELQRSRRVQKLCRVGGIMNGTCNYILDSMTRLGLTYADALAQAQALGYAEADPSTDIDGIDSWHKILLSANVAFGVSLNSATVPAAGIRHIDACDVAAFKEHGLVCKLITTAKTENGAYSAYVQPTLVPNGEPEAAVPANFNLITFWGEHSDRMSFYGQGAGRYPTAYNVVQDCADMISGLGFYCDSLDKVNATNDEKLHYYVRGTKDAWLEGITSENWGQAVITQPVAVCAMHQWLKQNPGTFIAALAN